MRNKYYMYIAKVPPWGEGLLYCKSSGRLIYYVEGLLYDTGTLSKSNKKQIVETEAKLIPL